MKKSMKRLMAFAMALCMCVTMVPAVFAAPDSEFILETSAAQSSEGGNYQVTYRAELVMPDDLATAAAVNKNDAELANIHFICTLTDNLIKLLPAGDELMPTADPSDREWFDFDKSDIYQLVDIKHTVGSDTLYIIYKLNSTKLSQWNGVNQPTVDEVKGQLLDRVTMTATQSVTPAQLNAAKEENEIETTAKVDIVAKGGQPALFGPVEGGEFDTVLNGVTAVCDAFSNYLECTSDMTITPYSSSPTVTFNANGGTVTPANATTAANGKLSSLPTPTREGFTFEGWYTAAEGGTEVTTATVFEANTTIYAHWTETTVTPPGGGEGGGGNQGGGEGGGSGSIDDEGALSGNEGHEVQIDNSNPKGNATTEKPKAIPTDRVVIDVEDIQKGYRVVRVIVRDAEGNEIEVDRESATSYSFVMPNGAVTVETVYDLSSTPPHKSGVSEHLITDEHVVFMTGYPNNTFMPNANVTRAEVATIFYALLRNKNVEITTKFNDVNANAWYSTFVNTLASLGVVSGVGDNKFDPERPITRAEFAVIASKFAKSTEHYYDFDDVPDSFWGNSFVNTAAAYGWVAGVGGNNYEPNRPITRAEVATIVNNMLGRVGDYDRIDDGHGRQFNDVSSTFWGRYEIAEASTDHDHTIDDEYIDETWHK